MASPTNPKLTVGVEFAFQTLYESYATLQAGDDNLLRACFSLSKNAPPFGGERATVWWRVGARAAPPPAPRSPPLPPTPPTRTHPPTPRPHQPSTASLR